MNDIQPIQLTSDQITRIQTAGRIIETERRTEREVAVKATLWIRGTLETGDLQQAAFDYLMLRVRNRRLPI